MFAKHAASSRVNAENDGPESYSRSQLDGPVERGSDGHFPRHPFSSRHSRLQRSSLGPQVDLLLRVRQPLAWTPAGRSAPEVLIRSGRTITHERRIPEHQLAGT